jgi:aminoglycoside phosphotransferase (APT) family kinase protein
VAGGAARRRVGLDAVDVLAALQAVDPDEVGPAGLRRPGWQRQVHESEVRDLSVVDAVHERLVWRAATLPPAEVRIAHGDFRPGNLAVGPEGWVRAVVRLGARHPRRPLADPGWLIASWGRPGDRVPPTIPGPSLAPGYVDRAELVARYAERSGRDVADLDFYVAFVRWRSACIGAGVYSRYAGGVMGAGEVAGGDPVAISVRAGRGRAGGLSRRQSHKTTTRPPTHLTAVPDHGAADGPRGMVPGW